MTGKNVKERIGLGGMDADRIREIMGEAPACPRKRRGTSGNDIIRPARKNGPMPTVRLRGGIPAWHCGRAASVAAYSRRPAPETVHPGGSLEKRKGHSGGVHQPPCLAASGRIQGNDGHDSGGVPARPGHKGSSPMTGDLPRWEHYFCF